MGNALVVMTIPEEALMSTFLYDVDKKGRLVRPADLHHGRWSQSRHRKEWMRRHPNAFIPVRVKPALIWRPPAEPFEKLGSEWIKDPKLRRAHRAAVRASLEAYINDGLSHLSHMVRTGAWVLERARVRVVECKPVPEGYWRAAARAAAKKWKKGRAEKPGQHKKTRSRSEGLAGTRAKAKGPSADMQIGPLPPPRFRPPITGKRIPLDKLRELARKRDA